MSAPAEPRGQAPGQTNTAKSDTTEVVPEVEIPAPAGRYRRGSGAAEVAGNRPRRHRASPRPPAHRGAGSQRWLGRQRLQPWLIALVVVAVVIGSVLRFVTSAHIWLDEALTIEISGRHLPQLFAALRHDGSPPLYYLLLHCWMELFGQQRRRRPGAVRGAQPRDAAAGLVRRAPGRAGRRVVRPHRAARRRPHRHRRPAAVRDLAVRDPLRHRDADVLAGRCSWCCCSRSCSPAPWSSRACAAGRR